MWLLIIENIGGCDYYMICLPCWNYTSLHCTTVHYLATCCVKATVHCIRFLTAKKLGCFLVCLIGNLHYVSDLNTLLMFIEWVQIPERPYMDWYHYQDQYWKILQLFTWYQNTEVLEKVDQSTFTHNIKYIASYMYDIAICKIINSYSSL